MALVRVYVMARHQLALVKVEFQQCISAWHYLLYIDPFLDERAS